jgi:acetyltransferase-like isoleucine patch superfamily enzyme
MKRIIKKQIKKNLYLNRFFYERKYYSLGISLFLINFIFQRFFRINSNTKWMVHFTSRIVSPNNIYIVDTQNSSSVYLSFSASNACYIQAINGIEIHKNVLWASGVKLISANHNISDFNISDKCNKMVINESVWLGANVIVLPGVKIGKFAIVGAGSVVTKNIPSYTISVGNPAQVIIYRCKKCLSKLEEFKCLTCNIAYGINDYIEKDEV